MVRIHVACILSDLWDDYCYFRKMAQETPFSTDRLLHKRYVRAALWTLFAYFEGVINRGVHSIDSDLDLEDTPLCTKIGRLRQEAKDRTRGNRKVAFLDINAPKSLRNRIAHLKPTDDPLELVERLSDGSAFRDADRIIGWLDAASRALRMDRHPNAQATLDEFVKALGSPANTVGSKTTV
jgi:hypothetical protein